MADRVPNEIKLVAWFMAAKNVIKFANDDTTYKLAEAVVKASNFEKFPLSKGDKVEVGIKEGVVTFLRKQKSDAPKVESKGSEEAYEPTAEEEAGPSPKEIAKPTQAPTPKVEAPTSDARELTVFAVAANKKVVKFLEVKDDGWYQIAPEIQAQDYATIGLIAKNRVKVTLVDKTVTSLVKVASEPAEQTKTATSSPVNAKVEPTAASAVQTPTAAPTAKKEWVPYKSQDTDARQTSIEAQACLNSANQVVGRIAANIDPKPTASVINAMIRAIAEENYKLLQELKKK